MSFTNETCQQFSIKDTTCAGHGVCDALVGCICEDGWTGISDWVDSNQLDCGVNIMVIKILWIVNLASAIGGALASRPHFVRRYRLYLSMEKKAKSRGKQYRFWHNRGLLSVVVFYCTCCVGQIILALLKIANYKRIVGHDLPVTIAWFVTRAGFWISSYLFQPALLQSILKGTSATKKMVRYNDWFAFGVMLLSSLGGLYVLPLLLNYTQKTGETMWVVYNLTVAVILIAYGSHAIFLKRKILDALGTASSTDSKGTIKEKLIDVQNTVFKQGFLQVPIYVTFAVYSYLWNKYSYFLPISFLAFPLIGHKLAATGGADRTASDYSSSKAGSENKSQITSRTGVNQTGISNTNVSFQKLSSFNESNAEPEEVVINMDAVSNTPLAPIQHKDSATDKTNIYKHALEEPAALKALLEKPDGRASFMEHTKSSFAEENVEFWEAIEQYENNYGGEISDSERQLAASNLMNKYVVDNAPRQVNLPSKIRDALLKIDPTKYEATSFSHAKSEIFKLMYENFYTDFLDKKDKRSDTETVKSAE